MLRLRLHRHATAAILAVLLAFAPPLHAADRFFSNVDDLPLMAGLQEDAETSMVFDKPDGRIVDVVAYGEAGAAEVVRFYRKTLPQLGWDRIEDNRYLREGEMLIMKVTGEPDITTVRFSIRPE